MIGYLKALTDIHFGLSVDGVLYFIRHMSFPVATVAIGLLILLAVQGYKIFRSLLYVVAAVGLGFAGHLYLAPRVSSIIVSKFPIVNAVDVDVAIAFICAMFGILIVHLTYEFVVFCMGGAAGFLLGYFFVAQKLAAYFFNLGFLKHKIAQIAIGCVCAMIVAILFLLLFKHLYIMITSVGFMGLSGYILYRQVMPTPKTAIAFGFIAVCAIIGIFMMVHQYEEEEKRTEYRF